MRVETAKRLRDALSAAIEIQDVATKAQSQGTDQQRVYQLAIERLLAIVGEALNRAIQSDGSLEGLVPDARLIVGMRNRIVHGYDEIQDEIIWDAAWNSIPELIDHLESLLAGGTPPYP